MNGWVAERISFISTTEKGKSLVVDFDWIWTQREDVKVEREGERGGREVDSVSRYGLSVSLFRFLSHTHRHPREAGFPATPSPFFAATAMPCHVICVGSLAGKQSRCAIFHLGPRGSTLQRLTWGWRGQTGSSDLRDESVSTGLASSGGMMTGKRRRGLGLIGQVGARHEVGQRSAIPRRSQVDERPADGSRRRGGRFGGGEDVGRYGAVLGGAAGAEEAGPADGAGGGDAGEDGFGRWWVGDGEGGVRGVVGGTRVAFW
jgi:hypothetical protein